MNNHYLIFRRTAHSFVDLIRAASVTESIRDYIVEQNPHGVTLGPDGSLTEHGVTYPHPLAYIEANDKVEGEWQIRELPEWAWQDRYTEAFCGESHDGPQWVIDDCRPHFKSLFPRVRAQAFLWYFKQGVLVTFYRKNRRRRFEVLQRYYWEWDGSKLTVEEWAGNYDDIIESLDLRTHRLPQRTSQSVV